jgi:hypothetical protein
MIDYEAQAAQLYALRVMKQAASDDLEAIEAEITELLENTEGGPELLGRRGAAREAKKEASKNEKQAYEELVALVKTWADDLVANGLNPYGKYRNMSVVRKSVVVVDDVAEAVGWIVSMGRPDLVQIVTNGNMAWFNALAPSFPISMRIAHEPQIKVNSLAKWDLD